MIAVNGVYGQREWIRPWMRRSRAAAQRISAVPHFRHRLGCGTKNCGVAIWPHCAELCAPKVPINEGREAGKQDQLNGPRRVSCLNKGRNKQQIAQQNANSQIRGEPALFECWVSAEIESKVTADAGDQPKPNAEREHVPGVQHGRRHCLINMVGSTRVRRDDPFARLAAAVVNAELHRAVFAGDLVEELSRRGHAGARHVADHHFGP